MGNQVSSQKSQACQTELPPFKITQGVQLDAVTLQERGQQSESVNLHEKSLQTTFPPILQTEIVEHCSILIQLPNYTYAYEGPLDAAPHKQRGITPQQWATKAEAALIKQRKLCEWVKNRTMMRDGFVTIHLASRGNSGPETIPVSWTIPPEMPRCKMPTSPGDRWGNTGACYGSEKCFNHCYYRYMNDLQAHYKTCSKCSELPPI